MASRYVVGRILPFEFTDTNIAAVVRDTLYIDGGTLSWEQGMSDGTFSYFPGDGEIN